MHKSIIEGSANKSYLLLEKKRNPLEKYIDEDHIKSSDNEIITNKSNRLGEQ